MLQCTPVSSSSNRIPFPCHYQIMWQHFVQFSRITAEFQSEFPLPGISMQEVRFPTCFGSVPFPFPAEFRFPVKNYPQLAPFPPSLFSGRNTQASEYSYTVLTAKHIIDIQMLTVNQFYECISLKRNHNISHNLLAHLCLL